MALISIKQLRADLKSGPDDDADLAMLLSVATDQWEQETGRPWLKATGAVFEYIPVDDRQTKLWLPLTPVTAVTKVEWRKVTESTWTTLATDTYFLASTKFGRLERLKSNWEERVQVTYNGGYDETNTPDGVKHALITQIRFLRARLEEESIASRGKSVQGGSVTFLEKADLHPLFRSMAARWRRIP